MTLQEHFVTHMKSSEPFESHEQDYLKRIQVVDAVFRSQEEKALATLAQPQEVSHK